MEKNQSYFRTNIEKLLCKMNTICRDYRQRHSPTPSEVDEDETEEHTRRFRMRIRLQLQHQRVVMRRSLISVFGNFFSDMIIFMMLCFIYDLNSNFDSDVYFYFSWVLDR